MSEFIVKYWRKDKRTGTQSYGVKADSFTYENVLFQFVLNDICKSTYHVEYFFPMLNDDVFIKRINVNNFICSYEIILCNNYTKAVVDEFFVEIKCKINDESIDLSEELNSLEAYKPLSNGQEKTKQLTEWLIKENYGVRMFIVMLESYGSLKKLKSHYSKSTYHRNLKICQDKGYVKNGELAKRVYITKK